MSSHTPSKEWFYQRLSAIFIAISVISFVFAIIIFNKKTDLSVLDKLSWYMVYLLVTPYDEILWIANNPFVLYLAVLTLFTAVYHGLIGIKIIIQDYISQEKKQKILITTIYCLSWIVFSCFVASIAKLHYHNINATYNQINK